MGCGVTEERWEEKEKRKEGRKRFGGAEAQARRKSEARRDFRFRIFTLPGEIIMEPCGLASPSGKYIT